MSRWIGDFINFAYELPNQFVYFVGEQFATITYARWKLLFVSSLLEIEW